jgi:dynein light chain roadblock-type
MYEVAQVEEMVKRLSDQRGVLGVVVADGAGVPVRSTMDPAAATTHAAMAARLAAAARAAAREVAPGDDLRFVRLRCGGREIIVAPDFDKDNGMSLTVVQNPNPEQPEG